MAAPAVQISWGAERFRSGNEIDALAKNVLNVFFSSGLSSMQSAE